MGESEDIGKLVVIKRDHANKCRKNNFDKHQVKKVSDCITCVPILGHGLNTKLSAHHDNFATFWCI